jgi:hypothetical protein
LKRLFENFISDLIWFLIRHPAFLLQNRCDGVIFLLVQLMYTINNINFIYHKSYDRINLSWMSDSEFI